MQVLATFLELRLSNIDGSVAAAGSQGTSAGRGRKPGAREDAKKKKKKEAKQKLSKKQKMVCVCVIVG